MMNVRAGGVSSRSPSGMPWSSHLHDLPAMDDRAVPFLIARHLTVRGDRHDAVAQWPVANRGLPHRGEIEVIAAIEHHAIALLSDRHMEFARRDQAAVARKRPAFRTYEAICLAVAEAGIGPPYRFDHLDFAGIVGISPDDGAPGADRSVRIEGGGRVHPKNTIGTWSSRKKGCS